MSTIQELAVVHPCYCSESNYYSNRANMHWETMTDFLDEFEDADIDMNLIFRWDIIQIKDDGVCTERYTAEIFIMHQRKGIFSPHMIKNVDEAEAKRFESFVKNHWKVLKLMWEPLSIHEQT